jgi:dUTP pyrophosphatase
MIKAFKLTESAIIPKQNSEGAAGYDLHASHAITIPAGNRSLVDTGISLEIPPSMAGLIWPRSGLAVKEGIDVGAGLIDSDYRGEIKVLLFNHSIFDFKIKKGDRIAQIVFQRVHDAPLIECDSSMSETERGAGGFGSTGK